MSELLTVEDIARLWKVTRDYAQRYIVKRPEFPPPVPGSTRKQKRWRPEDIAQFINQGQT